MSISGSLEKTKLFILRHKFWSLVAIIIILAGAYFAYGAMTKTTGATSYVTSKATNGTITTSVSGSGQVAASNQIDIKPEASGKLVYINTQTGQPIKAGTLLAEIDPTDAQKAVASAENDLANAQLSTTDISGTANDALDTSYDTGLTALTDTYKDLATIKTNLDSPFQTSSYNGSDSDMNYYLKFVKFYTDNPSDLNYWTSDAEKKYTDAQTALSAVEEKGWLVSKNSSATQIDGSISDTYDASETFLDLIRQAFNLVQEYQKIVSDESLTTPIKAATTTTQLTNLSDAVTSLTADTTALFNAKTDITSKEQDVAKIGVDTQSQNLNIEQYQNALSDAQDALAKYYVNAPFDGTIATTTSGINIGDNISSGTVLGSFITNQEIITASFNEVDVVKIALGQKVVITFDALPNFSATGKVASIDTVSTTSQGVVSYGVKIALDTNDDSIKPGMSASMNIITNVKQDVLMVPNAAVKTQGGAKYVQVLVNGVLQQKPVTVGLANDTDTEIITGLSAGDDVVTQTITSGSSTTATTSATRSALGRGLTGGAIIGGGGGFGGAAGGR